MSAKTRARAKEVQAVRRRLIAESRWCMLCRRGGRKANLMCHEIARGPHRQKALDKPYAILVVCETCHRVVHGTLDWPESRQLFRLKLSAPGRYDLDAYNRLVGRGENRITPADVEQWWWT